MVTAQIFFDDRFTIAFSNIKDESLKAKIRKQIDKLKTTPEVGKPMRYERKGTRELYVKPYRLNYEYHKSEQRVVILDLYHKKGQ